MLNLDETIIIQSEYLVQKDLYLKAFSYAFGVTVFLDILRSQVPEVNLLQIIPGFYILLVFSSLFCLLVFSDFIFRIPIELDAKKEQGTKTINRIQLITLLKVTFSFLFSTLFIVLNTIIPLSLDSFDSYGENALESLWSFEEVISLESILLFLLLFLSQFPIIITSFLTTEIDISLLQEFWRIIVFVSVIVSGVITPTLDINTQLSFVFFTSIFYLFIINIIEKRVNIKFIGLNSINS